MRVGLDTNLLLSALISSGSVPDQVYRAWEDGVFDLLTSKWQLEELRRASRYPKLRRYIKPHEAEMMVGGLRPGALILAELPAVDVAPDPNDNPLLATALAGEADYLVSGDKIILGLERLENTRILTARSFLDEVIKQAPKPVKSFSRSIAARYHFY